MPRDGKRTPQQDVAELVARRGYRKGWTAEQFIARQVCKLSEEVGEATRLVNMPGQMAQLIINTGNIAAWAFRDEHHWPDVDQDRVLAGVDALKVELADIQVVVFSLAQALAELSGEAYDVVEAALVKARADVVRGKSWGKDYGPNVA